MSAKERLAIQRALQRVSNALNNPTTTELMWQDAWVGVKGIVVLNEDIAVWWRIGLEKRRFDMLQTLVAGGAARPFKRTRTANETAVFARLLVEINKRSTERLRIMMREFLSVCRLNADMREMLYVNAFTTQLGCVFALRCAEPVILDLYQTHGYKKTRDYFYINKGFRERRTARWRLIRFWLLVKKIVRGWREILYEPGTGALYKKALLSFSQDN